MSALTLLAGLALAETWTPYVPKDGHFKATFPGTVETQVQDTSDGKVKMSTKVYRAKTTTGLLCHLSVTSLPPQTTDSTKKKVYEDIVYGFIHPLNLQKLEERDATFGENKGKYIKISKGKIEGAMWIVIKKDEIFTLVAANSNGNSTAVESKFFASFKLTK